MKEFKGLTQGDVYVVFNKIDRITKVFRLSNVYSNNLRKEDIVVRSKSIITLDLNKATVEYSQDVYQQFQLLKSKEVIYREASKELELILERAEEESLSILPFTLLNLYQESLELFGDKKVEEVTILDKTFTLYLTQDEIESRIEDLAQSINNNLNLKTPPVFLVVLKGGFMFASELIKRVTRECETHFITASSYRGTQRDEIVTLSELNSFDLTGKDIYIIEDIVDSGNTLKTILEKFDTLKVNSVKVLTLFDKPAAHKNIFTNITSCFKIPNDFIVGYGLDYNQLGRNLTNIYKLKDEKLF